MKRGLNGNRSTAPTAEMMGALNVATEAAISSAIATFEGIVDVSTLSDDQKAGAYRLLANGVTAGIAQQVKSILK